MKIISGDIRRQVYDLSIADLSACPAWIFAADEERRLGQRRNHSPAR